MAADAPLAPLVAPRATHVRRAPHAVRWVRHVRRSGRTEVCPPHAAARAPGPVHGAEARSQRPDVPVVAGRTHRAIGGQAGARSPERGPVARASDRQGPARVGRTRAEVRGPSDWTHVARNVEAMATMSERPQGRDQDERPPRENARGTPEGARRKRTGAGGQSAVQQFVQRYRGRGGGIGGLTDSSIARSREAGGSERKEGGQCGHPTRTFVERMYARGGEVVPEV
jgi:hypothetical protein